MWFSDKRWDKFRRLSPESGVLLADADKWSIMFRFTSSEVGCVPLCAVRSVTWILTSSFSGRQLDQACSMSWFIASQPHEMLSSFLTHHIKCNWWGSEVQPFRLRKPKKYSVYTFENTLFTCTSHSYMRRCIADKNGVSPTPAAMQITILRWRTLTSGLAKGPSTYKSTGLP